MLKWGRLMSENVHLEKKIHSKTMRYSCLITICVPNIFKHSGDVSNILSHMRAIASFNDCLL